ncbi:GNAT family N-acetyltransferase [Cognatiyoonia sp. IB215182]|uniref:GNAT family N-acetyltransferase n=1 Tax=Cognatiyoonia sp. IB215182 TaxID=3097353 RepID=UPI002A0FE900|nr:GNAT family N-acetyltransferase [Cognatiyoonia sp. IB215182]MDX8351476.1 GNAT family N-acetyltransferase [Cognatiyoonia sp. IB215182]
MSDVTVHHEKGESKGRYFVTHAEGESELTYSVMSPTLVIADHTSVAAGQEGQGIGLLMLEQFIADARESGFKIMPLCPFVNAQRRKHPDWADVFAT